MVHYELWVTDTLGGVAYKMATADHVPYNLVRMAKRAVDRGDIVHWFTLEARTTVTYRPGPMMGDE